MHVKGMVPKSITTLFLRLNLYVILNSNITPTSSTRADCCYCSTMHRSTKKGVKLIRTKIQTNNC